MKKSHIVLLILTFLLVVIIIPIGAYMLLFKDFYVKEFTNKITINFKDEYIPKDGRVCFGNKISCKDVKPTRDGDVDVNKVGEYKVVYTYKVKNKVLKKEQIVEVLDNEKPVIEVDDKTFTYCPGGKFEDISKIKVSATDNYDGDITDKVEKEIKDNKIEFKVSDSSGNESIVYREAKEEDKTKPVIKLKGDSSIYVKLNGSYKEKGASASDNCEGDITDKIKISGSVNTKKAGEYKLTYNVEDQKGNKASVVRKVFVYQKNNSSSSNNTSKNTKTGNKNIYLTFDDGPGPYTAKLLDILKKYDVKATFFVTNQGITKGYDNMILRAYQEGHTIGLHTNSHNYKIYKNEETYFKDLYAIQDKVKRITGSTSMIIRFPGGSSNTISRNYDNGAKIMSVLTKAVEAKGFRYFDWNITSGDAGETTNTNTVYKNIVNSLGNGNTYMVLQHDIKGFSVNAVEKVIQYGLAHGYNFKAITMDTPTVHHSVNN